jgi:hypothetical protein
MQPDHLRILSLAARFAGWVLLGTVAALVIVPFVAVRLFQAQPEHVPMLSLATIAVVMVVAQHGLRGTAELIGEIVIAVGRFVGWVLLAVWLAVAGTLYVLFVVVLFIIMGLLGLYGLAWALFALLS